MSRQISVFISYSHTAAQQRWVESMAQELGAHGLKVWLDQWSIKPGDHVPDSLERGLRDSDAVVAVLSRDQLNKPNVLFELGAAIGMGKKLIPVLPAAVSPSELPFDLRSRQFLKQQSPSRTAREVAAALTGSARKTALAAA